MDGEVQRNKTDEGRLHRLSLVIQQEDLRPGDLYSEKTNTAQLSGCPGYAWGLL